jgi:hypothetical protein
LEVQESKQQQYQAGNPKDEPVLADGPLPDNLVDVVGCLEGIEDDVSFRILDAVRKDQEYRVRAGLHQE